MLCISCGSFRHLMAQCPDSWENMASTNKVNVVDSATHKQADEQVILFTGYQKDNLQQLGIDAQNCVVLDSACSSTVCGATWMNNYLNSLRPEERVKVCESPGKKIFKFGGG